MRPQREEIHDDGGRSGSREGHESANWWLRLYEESETRLPDLTTLTWMASYNRYLFERISNEIRVRSASGQRTRVWDAGAGVDLVPFKLKKVFGDTIILTVSDISEKCILANKMAYEKAGLKADFVVGDLFKSDYVEEFDIVMNTGLLEHFGRGEQEDLLRVISKSLRPGGVFMTLVPYAGGRLYTHCMKRLVRKGKWRHEAEHPVTTFSSLELGDLTLEEEVPTGAVDQFASFRAAYPLLFSLARPAIAFFEVLPSTELFLTKIIGGYCLFARFVKRKDAAIA